MCCLPQGPALCHLCCRRPTFLLFHSVLVSPFHLACIQLLVHELGALLRLQFLAFHPVGLFPCCCWPVLFWPRLGRLAFRSVLATLRFVGVAAGAFPCSQDAVSATHFFLHVLPRWVPFELFWSSWGPGSGVFLFRLFALFSLLASLWSFSRTCWVQEFAVFLRFATSLSWASLGTGVLWVIQGAGGPCLETVPGSHYPNMVLGWLSRLVVLVFVLIPAALPPWSVPISSFSMGS